AACGAWWMTTFAAHADWLARIEEAELEVAACGGGTDLAQVGYRDPRGAGAHEVQVPAARAGGGETADRRAAGDQCAFGGGGRRKAGANDCSRAAEIDLGVHSGDESRGACEPWPGDHRGQLGAS